jgi:hypothetical protein
MGGLTEETDSNELVSLGTIAYEPIWLFSHKITTDRGLFSLEKKRVSVGPEGSSSRAIVDQLLKKNAMEEEPFQKLGLEPEQTEDALVKGQIDAAIMVNSFASPVIRQLAKNPKIDMANFRRADAYVARLPFLDKVTIPEGAVDIQKDLPPHETTLLATKTSLIVRGDLHPALQYLLLEAASQIHSHHGIFQKAGEFPSAETQEFPLSPDARHFYKSGKPFLQRYLPFWLAALVEQAIVLLLPILGLMYPLTKGLAGLYGWGMQRRIFLLYGELHWVDSQIDQLGRQNPPQEILDRMKRLEDRANRVRVAQNYIPMLYDLKQSITSVRARLDKKAKGV